MVVSSKGIIKALIRLADAQAGLLLSCSKTLKTGFLASRPICFVFLKEKVSQVLIILRTE